MYARIKKIIAVFLCLVLAAGFTGSAAEGVSGERLMERMGESLLSVLTKIFEPTGDKVTAGDWMELKLAAMKGSTEVVITADITFSDNQGTIVFERPVSIVSAEGTHFTIDGNGKQIFCVQGKDAAEPLAGVTYVVNLSFQNGDATQHFADAYGTGSGGALFVMGDLRAIGCTFTGNRANYGAAVCADGSLALDNCVVQDNVSTGAGAAYALNGDVAVLGGTISGNTAEQYGGGLYAHGGNIAIAGAAVTDNAAQFGGGIYAQYGSVTVSGDADISHNTAAVSGGAIYAESGGVAMTGGAVSGNTAQYGAVYLGSGEGSFSGITTFTDNGAEFGGAIYAQTANVTISGDVSLQGNKANVSGGGVYAHEGAVGILGGTLTQNSAMYGGCVYADSGNIMMSGGRAIDNTADFGAVLYLTGGDVSISGGILRDNTANTSGGAVYAHEGAVMIAGGNIKKNQAMYGGGVLAASGAITMTAGVVFGNTAQYGGGIYTVDGDVTVSGGRVNSNIATVSGGGVYTETGTVTDVLGAVFGNTPDDIVQPQPQP
ncbi:MAG: hypothetical protein ABIK64_02890 [Bacillota bacterium]